MNGAATVEPPRSTDAPNVASSPEVSSRARVRVDGKFFRLGSAKFFPKGVTYGPFAPNAAGERYASREQTIGDFTQIRELGANTLRVYHVPPHWFLDLAQEHGLTRTDPLKLYFDIVGEERMLFGTRMPAIVPEIAILEVQDSDISDSARRRVLTENARRIFHLADVPTPARAG